MIRSRYSRINSNKFKNPQCAKHEIISSDSSVCLDLELLIMIEEGLSPPPSVFDDQTISPDGDRRTIPVHKYIDNINISITNAINILPESILLF